MSRWPTGWWTRSQCPGGPGPDGPGGGNAIVLADGTLIVTRHIVDTATDTSATQLIAITPAGTTAWNVTLADGGHFTVSGSNLLSVTSSATDTAVTSTVTARSTATGAVAWTATINGRITDLEPFSGGTYAVVVTPRPRPRHPDSLRCRAQQLRRDALDGLHLVHHRTHRAHAARCVFLRGSAHETSTIAFLSFSSRPIWTRNGSAPPPPQSRACSHTSAGEPLPA